MTTYALDPPTADRRLARAARGVALVFGFTAYIAIAAMAVVVYPLLAPVFVAPFALAILIRLPRGKAASRPALVSALVIGTSLLALWPVYLHVKPGPLPILTPPRVILYVVTAVWILDMARSPLRRAHLAQAIASRPFVAGGAAAMAALGLASLPMAEGRSIAAPEFFREVIIWYVPCAVAATYVRTDRDLERLVRALTLTAGVIGAIAIAEKLSGTLLATLLSPLMADNSWLNNVQSQKIRDGVFRAQSVFTHPLALGEYMAMTAPFAVVFALTAKRWAHRSAWIAIAVAITVGAVATSSRAAIVAFFLSAAVLAALLAMRFLRENQASPWRPLIGLVAACVLVASPAIGGAGYRLVTGAGGGSAAKSSQARLTQIEMAIPKIARRPLLGYGVGRAPRILGYYGRGLTIDNYYLSLALDVGLLGPIAFLVMMGGVVRRSMERARRGATRHQMLYLGLAASAIGFMTFRAVSSLAGSTGVLYILIGAFIGAGAAHAAKRRSRRTPFARAREATDFAP